MDDLIDIRRKLIRQADARVEVITEVAEPAIDRDEIILRQDILLERYQPLAEEIKRRIGRDVPDDLRFEVCELLRKPLP